MGEPPDGVVLPLDVRTSVRHAMRMNVRTNLLLPEDLVREMDELAGPRGRSRFVAEAVAYKLRRERLRQAWDRARGSIRAEDYPHWATPEKVDAWIEEMRAEVTDPGPDPIPKLSDPRAPAG
jgi:predicted transcriptional regulator